jgi:hypothetical protein
VVTLNIPVERINTRARKADLSKALLWLLFVVPFVVGWLIGKVCLLVALVWSAGVEGWAAGRGRKDTRR